METFGKVDTDIGG